MSPANARNAPAETVSNAPRVELPLLEHPLLDFDTHFVRMTIRPVEAGETPFAEVHGHVSHRRPITVRAEGGVTRISLDMPWTNEKEKWWEGNFWESGFWEKRFFGKNGARIVLHVPSDLRARIRSSAARIDVEHLHGCDLSIDADAGSLSLNDVQGRLRLVTNAGRIDGRDVGGTLDVTTNAGSVKLDVTSLDPGKHRVGADMGAVRVRLARGMPVRVDAKTQMGSSRIDYPIDRESPISLELEADLGSIRVEASDRVYHTHSTQTPPPAPSSPYRTPASPNEAELERILARVAEGSLSPSAAKDLLRELGWS